MVDSITPATDDRLRELVRQSTGFDDKAPVAREAFAQWVVEDDLPDGMPDLSSVGVQLAHDVGAWERAKLRILNGAHSTIAYTGLLLGHETVADAMADPILFEFVQRLIVEDIVPSLESSPIDLGSYVRDTLQRFRNPAIHHRLSQIAWDGSQKLPYRLLDTIADARAAGRPIHRLAIPIAAWLLFIERQTCAGADIVDPLADKLKQAVAVEGSVDAILALREIFPLRLAMDSIFRNAVVVAVETIRRAGVRAALSSEPALG
jgi:fructuronate reductase